LAIVMEDMVVPFIADGRLVLVLEDWSPPFSGYHLYYPNRRHPSRGVRCSSGGTTGQLSSISRANDDTHNLGRRRFVSSSRSAIDRRIAVDCILHQFGCALITTTKRRSRPFAHRDPKLQTSLPAKCSVLDGGPDDDVADVNMVGLLDRKHHCAGDRVRL